LFIPLNHVEDFLAMHGQFRGSLDTELNGVAIDSKDLNDDMAVDNNALV
jgi:hypothetical protein